MALDSGIKTIRNLKMIVFQLLKKNAPTVCYVDNQTMWDNLMNSTVPSIPEVYYRFREAIQHEVINSVCLIPGSDNPSDAMKKAKDNGKLKRSIADGICITPPTRVFMLQLSKYRNATYIPTLSVTMVDDQEKIEM